MQDTKVKMEILAPAGDAEMLRAAVLSGADCVYVGVEGFNARSGAGNFDAAGLCSAVAFCHARNCKLYAALNIIVLPGEEEACKEAILAVAAAGCDGMIVQDLGAAEIAKQLVPSLPLFASTQMSVHSLAGVQTLEKLGFAQAILARELSKTEIGHIAKNTALPLEVFVHGALCVCVSGQCYFSAFLGGRSANRGACAGTCRLPFEAVLEAKQGGANNVTTNHLSLKDLSVLEDLPALQQMGVKTAKIEGRLRGAEYVAAVVQAARLALDGKEYNKQFVQDIYSRSGFTQGWYTGEKGGGMFGMRTEKDMAAARAAAPKARDIYRRELQRVPVNFHLVLQANSVLLSATVGKTTVQTTKETPLGATASDASALLEKALSKTGGTPFYLGEAKLETNGFYLAAGELNPLKTQLLEELLQKLEQNSPHKVQQEKLEICKNLYTTSKTSGKKPRLVARFETMQNLPAGIEGLCDVLVLPLDMQDKIPPEWRKKTYLHLPRIAFPKNEERVVEFCEKAKKMGFAGFEAGGLAHFSILEGEDLFGGFSLNITNILAANKVGEMGCSAVTLSPELTLAQAGKISKSLAQDKRSALIAYGYMPLMATRACPLQNVRDCAGCPKQGFLHDRKGKNFAVHCAGGVRTIYNTVPTWMGDRPAIKEAANDLLLYFTHETTAQVQKIIEDFKAGRSFGGEVTRGLCEKGVSS